MHLGDRIKARRVSLGWSQRELAERMGYKNHSVIARVEAGKVDLPQSRLDQFAQVLGLSPGYLLGLVSEETGKKNSQLARLTLKMKNDVEFFNLVSALADLDEKQYRGVVQLVAALNEEQ